MVAVNLRFLMLGAAAALVAIVSSQAASAAPFIDVRSEWRLLYNPLADGSADGESNPLPAGLKITCGGTAVIANGVSTETGCEDSISVNHIVTSNETASVQHSGTLSVANTEATPFTGPLTFDLYFSAFSPYSSVGIGIDNASQSAAFSSRFSSDVQGSDFHSCDLPAAPLGFTADASGYNFSHFYCGVLAPDESFFSLGFGPLLPGQEQTFFGLLSITDTFSGIPEPSALGILASGIVALGLLRRRRAAR